jgi:hypothetical protein
MSRVLGFLALCVLTASLAITLVHWSRICLSMEVSRTTEDSAAALSVLGAAGPRSSVDYGVALEHAVGLLGIFFATFAALAAVGALYGAIGCVQLLRRGAQKTEALVQHPTLVCRLPVGDD